MGTYFITAVIYKRKKLDTCPQGDTALHVMAKHERLECVLALISYAADINVKVRYLCRVGGTTFGLMTFCITTHNI